MSIRINKTNKINVVFIGAIGNPMATSWWYGLTTWTNLIFIDTSGISVTKERIAQVGLPEEAIIYSAMNQSYRELIAIIENEFGNRINIIIGWWGSNVINDLEKYKKAFPRAISILIIDTLPNASNLLSELREILVYNKATWINGFISYSKEMTDLMKKRVFHARNKPFLELIQPFPQRSYSNDRDRKLNIEKSDEIKLIFTGRSDLLFRSERQFKKDAVGNQLIDIAKRGIRIFVHEKANLDVNSILETYPEFSNEELLDGTFANFVSQFDGHLTIYNEFNTTIKRRVSTGLSTRLSLAMTAEAPIIATRTSSFLNSIWKDKPFGILYDTHEDLVNELKNRRKMLEMRENIILQRDSLSMEGQRKNISDFFNACLLKFS